MGDCELPSDAPRPRLSHLIKRIDFVGYGFNLHAERNKVGQYVGKVDEGSPAALSGMKEHDRIVEVNGVNIGNENHKQVVERIKTNPNEAQLLVVDRQTDAYYKEKKIVIKGTLPSVLYLRTPTIAEEEEAERLKETLAKRVTINEPAKFKNEEDYDPNYATIATPSPPPPPEVSSPPSPDEPSPNPLNPEDTPAPPTPPPQTADVLPPPQPQDDSSPTNQLEIEIPSQSVATAISPSDSVTPPPPYERLEGIAAAVVVTPDASPLPSPNADQSSSLMKTAAHPPPPPAGEAGVSVSHSNKGGVSQGNYNNNNNNNNGPSAASGEPPVFGLSVAEMRARLGAKKKVDTRREAEANQNFKEKYEIFQKL